MQNLYGRTSRFLSSLRSRLKLVTHAVYTASSKARNGELYDSWVRALVLRSMSETTPGGLQPTQLTAVPSVYPVGSGNLGVYTGKIGGRPIFHKVTQHRNEYLIAQHIAGSVAEAGWPNPVPRILNSFETALFHITFEAHDPVDDAELDNPTFLRELAELVYEFQDFANRIGISTIPGVSQASDFEGWALHNWASSFLSQLDGRESNLLSDATAFLQDSKLSVCHGDVMPANLLRDRNSGRLLIADLASTRLHWPGSDFGRIALRYPDRLSPVIEHYSHFSGYPLHRARYEALLAAAEIRATWLADREQVPEKERLRRFFQDLEHAAQVSWD